MCAEWFEPDGSGSTPLYQQFSAEQGRALRLRFYSDQLYSPVAHQLQDLHRLVLPGWWVETAVDAAGRPSPTAIWAWTCLWRHWRYALQPGTMLFHHRRLADVFCSLDSLPTLWLNMTRDGSDVTHRTQTVSWLAQRKAWRVISTNRRKRWLSAVSAVLSCAFQRHDAAADVISIILKDLERWAKRSLIRYTNARYALDDAVEEALVATFTANKRRKT